MNRVTDTCIPEMEAMRRIEKVILEEWQKADRNGASFFPHEFAYEADPTIVAPLVFAIILGY